MNNKTRVTFIFIGVVGVLLLILGTAVFTSQELKMASGLCFGIGSAMLVLGIGNLLRSFIVSKDEYEKIKQVKDIEVNDERNIRIREKTGYMTAKVMNYVICALVLVLAFMKVDRIVIIVVASLILIEFVLVIMFSNYYSKKI